MSSLQVVLVVVALIALVSVALAMPGYGGYVRPSYHGSSHGFHGSSHGSSLGGYGSHSSFGSRGSYGYRQPVYSSHGYRQRW
ncbi:neuropeptide-like protein 30 isoform X4 [Penaeus japonicus]|uniref:neuropeptide-like protein 30 isoform X4 n=1 Tax=Penaeus japonicus TaxID=27405 RepID=UPI001C711709|nr:neuropeptide-like protein 30 isoform X4 [Penaeus japonicus]